MDLSFNVGRFPPYGQGVKPTRQGPMLDDLFAFTYGAPEIEPFQRYCVNDITFSVIGPDIGIPNYTESVVK